MKLYWRQSSSNSRLHQLFAEPNESLVLTLQHGHDAWRATSLGRTQTWDRALGIDQAIAKCLMWFERLICELHEELMRVTFDARLNSRQ
jgi:hypothetical protein